MLRPGLRFSVTTTATPTLATWSGGDAPLTCTEVDMIPYDPDLGEDGQPSRCFTYYRYSSATDAHSINLAVTWTVGYTCSTGTCGGPLPDLTTSSTRDVIVKEIQAVGTPNPWRHVTRQKRHRGAVFGVEGLVENAATVR